MTNATSDSRGILSQTNIQKHAGMQHTHVMNERNVHTLILTHSHTNTHTVQNQRRHASCIQWLSGMTCEVRAAVSCGPAAKHNKTHFDYIPLRPVVYHFPFSSPPTSVLCTAALFSWCRAAIWSLWGWLTHDASFWCPVLETSQHFMSHLPLRLEVGVVERRGGGGGEQRGGRY